MKYVKIEKELYKNRYLSIDNGQLTMDDEGRNSFGISLNYILHVILLVQN